MKLFLSAMSAAIVLAANSAMAAPLHPMFTVNSTNRFGLRLMNQTVQTDLNEGKLKNTLTSPVSAYLAFSMALNGTAESTRSELVQSLGITTAPGLISIADINQSNKLVQEALSLSAGPKVERQWGPKPPVLKISNSAWHTNGATDGRHFEFSKGFKSQLNGYYKAEIGALDFRKEEGSAKINQWVNTNTNGLIKEIIDPDTLSEMLWVILNATYLEASWQKPFITMTKAPSFVLADGTQKSAKMIYGRDEYLHFEDSEKEVIEIPFANKGNAELAFYAILPARGTDFKTWMSAQAWDSNYWAKLMGDVKAAGSEFGTVTLPKFSFNYSLEMRKDQPLTTAMNLNYLFADNADFSAMATANSLASKVSLIKQDARIELDENGVKAAAVTLIGGAEATSVRPNLPKFNMVIDRPFAFAIADKSTGTLIFLGTVVDPQ